MLVASQPPLLLQNRTVSSAGFCDRQPLCCGRGWCPKGGREALQGMSPYESPPSTSDARSGTRLNGGAFRGAPGLVMALCTTRLRRTGQYLARAHTLRATAASACRSARTRSFIRRLPRSDGGQGHHAKQRERRQDTGTETPIRGTPLAASASPTRCGGAGWPRRESHSPSSFAARLSRRVSGCCGAGDPGAQ